MPHQVIKAVTHDVTSSWFYIKLKSCSSYGVPNRKKKWRPRDSKHFQKLLYSLVTGQCPVQVNSPCTLWPQCKYCDNGCNLSPSSWFAIFGHLTVGSVQHLMVPHWTLPSLSFGETSKCCGSSWQESGSLAMPRHPGSHRASVVIYHRAAAQTH